MLIRKRSCEPAAGGIDVEDDALRTEKTRRRRFLLPALLGLLIFARGAGADLEEADRLRDEGKYAQAVEAYEKILEAAPENAEALYGLGFCLTELGKKEAFSDSLWAARKHLEKLVKLEPDNAAYRFLNGYSAYVLAPRAPSYIVVLRDLAEKELRASLALRPDLWASWYILGLLLRDRGRAADAVEALSKAVSIEPDRLEPYPALALLLHGQKRYEECIQTCRALLEKSPSYHYGHKIIGDAWAASSDFAKAEAAYLRGAEAQPGEAVWADSLWRLFERSKDYPRAVGVFSGFLERHAESDPVRTYLGLAYAAMGEHGKAAEQFGILVERVPDQAWYRQWLAESLEAMGRWAEAEKAYLEALRLNPEASNALLPLRARYEKAKAEGRFAEALALMRQVASCGLDARTVAWLQFEIAECCRQRGDMKGAVEALEKAVELQPWEPWFFNNLGLYYRARGRVDEALARFEQALEIDPGYLYAIENMAATYQAIHKDDKARAWLAEGYQNAQEQHGYAPDMEVKSEREFDIFKFSYFLHELETVEDRYDER